MRHLPFYGRWFRFLMMYPGISISTDPFRCDPEFDDLSGRGVNPSNAKRRDQLTAWMASIFDDRTDLLEKSVPAYPPAGKRILQDNGSWLRCLMKPNVDFVNTPIARIEPDAVVTADGERYEADVICYATGFQANDYLAPIEFTGRGGASLREQWGDEPRGYLGITVPNFPNLFLLYGPGTNLAHGASIILHSECQVQYTMEAIRTDAPSGRAQHRSAARRARRIHDALPRRDRPADLVAPDDRAHALQEPQRQDLHALALAHRGLLGVDAHGGCGRLRPAVADSRGGD